MKPDDEIFVAIDDGLTDLQRASIRFFIEKRPTEPSTVVCQRAGISHDTYFRWKKDPNFTRALKEARDEIHQDGLAFLESKFGEACEKMHELMDCDKMNIQFMAAKEILEKKAEFRDLEDIKSKILEYQKRLGDE